MEEFVESRPSVCFEVEKVIAISNDGNYQVQWAPAWVSRLHLVGCEHLIQEFLRSQHVKNEPGSVAAEIPIPVSEWNDGLVQHEPNSTQDFICDTIIEVTKIQEECINPPEVKRELDAVQIQDYFYNAQELSSGDASCAQNPRKLGNTHCSPDERTETGGSGNNVTTPSVIVECAPLQCTDQQERVIPLGTVMADSSLGGQLFELYEESDAATNEREGKSAVSRFSSLPKRDSNALPLRKTKYSSNKHVKIDKQCSEKIRESDAESNVTGGVQVQQQQQQQQQLIQKQQQQPQKEEQQQPNHQQQQLLLRQWKQQGQEQSDSYPPDDTNSTFSCTVCNKGFTSLAGLEIHQRTHTFSCSLCGKHFSQKCNLNQHMRIHSDSKPFKCSVCRKTFAFNHHLAYHMRTHTGEKPYKCNLCGISFSRKDNLRVHIRRHSEPRSYSCGVCAETFTQSTQLKRHFKKTNHI